LVLAAASPLLYEAMSQESDEVVIFVPEVTATGMVALLDLIYKV
jgi:hypothetical protein